jgi:hypothetical protein
MRRHLVQCFCTVALQRRLYGHMDVLLTNASANMRDLMFWYIKDGNLQRLSSIHIIVQLSSINRNENEFLL